MSLRSYRSADASPAERGYDFGRTFNAEIRRNVSSYEELFQAVGDLSRVEVNSLGAAALDITGAWAPGLAIEIEAIASGAGLAPEQVGALNARTEILARCRARNHECTVVVALGPPGKPPLAAQTWDWHDHLAEGWLVWTFQESSGRLIQTLTEYGIVGKLGVSSSGIGLLLNILRHQDDAAELGTPIHVIARRILSESNDINEALRIIGSASPSASSAITLVAVDGQESTCLTAEVWPHGPSYVLPDRDGYLVHTNHFLDARAAEGDSEPVLGPDSLFRYETVRRRLATTSRRAESLLECLDSHIGGAGAVCCHPDARAALGDRYATLATVAFDIVEGRLNVHPGGPCTRDVGAPTEISHDKEAAWLG